MTIGILAFGSLLDDPGVEFACTVRRIEDVETPFSVEFGRESITRDGGPTLVRVDDGGTRVDASVLILKDTVEEEHARHMLYRRETRQVGTGASSRNWESRNIDTLSGFANVDLCLYTALEPNIPLRRRTAEHLAELAIRSATRAAGLERRDGISYLEKVKLRGVNTPLMQSYEKKILSQCNALSLADAWARTRADC